MNAHFVAYLVNANESEFHAKPHSMDYAYSLVKTSSEYLSRSPNQPYR